MLRAFRSHVDSESIRRYSARRYGGEDVCTLADLRDAHAPTVALCSKSEEFKPPDGLAFCCRAVYWPFDVLGGVSCIKKYSVINRAAIEVWIFSTVVYPRRKPVQDEPLPRRKPLFPPNRSEIFPIYLKLRCIAFCAYASCKQTILLCIQNRLRLFIP